GAVAVEDDRERVLRQLLQPEHFPEEVLRLGEIRGGRERDELRLGERHLADSLAGSSAICAAGTGPKASSGCANDQRTIFAILAAWAPSRMRWSKVAHRRMVLTTRILSPSPGRSSRAVAPMAMSNGTLL